MTDIPNDQTEATLSIDPDAPLQGQPHAIIERDGVRYTLLGTAHVSRTSAEVVRAAISSGAYDTVAVELDPQRAKAILDPESLAQLDLVKVLREEKTALFAANLCLSTYQRRMAEDLDIEVGAELKATIQEAEAHGRPVDLIDREVGLTLRRATEGLGWWRRAKIAGLLINALLEDSKVSEEEIESMKQGDMLESAFGGISAEIPQVTTALIDERDAYMAANLRSIRSRQPQANEVLAVIGAAHLPGMTKYLREDDRDPATLRTELERLQPKSSFPWFTLLLAFFVLGGFAWGFWRGGAEVGAELVLEWVLVTGTLGAIGCLLAGGHPLSILTAFVSSPITPLHPALASGTLSALVEAWVRKPTHADFMALRDDVQSVKGWWRNRVARTLLNFFLTSFGTAIGVWTGGAKMLDTLLG